MAADRDNVISMSDNTTMMKFCEGIQPDKKEVAKVVLFILLWLNAKKLNSNF